MSKSGSSGGIGIGTIIGLIFLWNVIFDNDEDVAKKVVVKESDNPEISEKIDQVRKNVKEAAEIAVELAREEFEKQKENLKDKEVPEEEVKEEVPQEPEEKHEGMKKL